MNPSNLTQKSSPQVKKAILKKSSFLTIPLGLVSVFFLLSFSFPNLSNKGSLFTIFHFEENMSDENISLSVNSSLLEGSAVQDAILMRMEQIEGVYSNNLNISMTDDNGNVVAICLTDLRENAANQCISSGKFYGLEDENADLNYSLDMGQVAFSNSGSLILEGQKGNSIISRKGWIEIESCDDGKLTGSFQFEIGEGDHTNVSSGYFKNVEFNIEE